MIFVLNPQIFPSFYAATEDSDPAKFEATDGIGQQIKELPSYVKQKRYVTIFDDVLSREFCEDVTYILPENNNCSRIVFTTRYEFVAPSSLESSLNLVYNLPTLHFEKSWQLFCKKVFHCNNGNQCPPELNELSIDIVKKCDGLPLAILIVGGVLSTKPRNVCEWKKFQDSLKTKLESNEQLMRVTKILSFSYHDLPHYLKSCLLYFGIFAEDYSIRTSRLIRQWIAEGFIKTMKGEVLEDVAEEYLTMLIQRSVIQVSKVDYWGRVKECRVHDMMREYILLKSNEMRFFQVLGENVDGPCQRLSILKNDTNGLERVSVPLIQSFFAFQMMMLTNGFLSTLLAQFKLLKILDHEDAPVFFLPDCIGNLFHLSYLSVRNTSVKVLPKTIGKLHQLETLDVKRSRVHELPVEIKRLRKLRHLLGKIVGLGVRLAYVQGLTIQEGLGCAETLLKLSHVDVDSLNGGTLIMELRSFSQLRKLGITNVTTGDVLALCAAIENMKQLGSLEIILLNQQQVLDLSSMVSPLPSSNASC